jgi:hypothetical protein
LSGTQLFRKHLAVHNAILDTCQDAWRKLLAEVGRITSIVARDWTIISQ